MAPNLLRAIFKDRSDYQVMSRELCGARQPNMCQLMRSIRYSSLTSILYRTAYHDSSHDDVASLALSHWPKNKNDEVGKTSGHQTPITNSNSCKAFAPYDYFILLSKFLFDQEELH